MSKWEELMQPTPMNGRRAGRAGEGFAHRTSVQVGDAEIAWGIYQGGAIRRVPRRRCAADLQREKYLREHRG